MATKTGAAAEAAAAAEATRAAAGVDAATSAPRTTATGDSAAGPSDHMAAAAAAAHRGAAAPENSHGTGLRTAMVARRPQPRGPKAGKGAPAVVAMEGEAGLRMGTTVPVVRGEAAAATADAAGPQTAAAEVPDHLCIAYTTLLLTSRQHCVAWQLSPGSLLALPLKVSTA